jgi:hypothetical protein
MHELAWSVGAFEMGNGCNILIIMRQQHPINVFMVKVLGQQSAELGDVTCTAG